MEERTEEFKIVPMTLDDLDDVLEVEKHCFTTPWSRFAFVNELRNQELCHYFVAKYGSRTIAYAGMWIVLDEAHVTNIGVLPEFRGFGLGELLMTTLIATSKKLGVTRMTLEVRKSNYIAQNLYTKLGFKPCGIRREYYMDDKEDAVIMWKDYL